ncbi:MAG: AAA family ATPase [Solobacterium sp.]|nr:AAA family ATPase [Solobacterium sp.]
MADRDKKREEKERLMREVLNKDRLNNTIDPNEAVELSLGIKKEVDEIADTMKSSNDALDALKAVLEKQKKDLEEMSLLNGLNTEEMVKVQKDLQDDYGVQSEAQAIEVLPGDSGEVFEEILNEVKRKVVVEEDTLRQLTTAFRRPYVMGETKGKAKNVILVTGPIGSGKHSSLSAVVRSIYERQIFISDVIYTIDMSLYQSGSQEQIFLQDLYKCLIGKGSVICFENFEIGFPAFLRMLDELVCEGKTVLSKRYVLNKGILVENQTGLVKEAVDSLSAEGKYLVFMTTKGTKSVQDAFGADFLYHVLDTVTFPKLDDERMNKIIHIKMTEFQQRSLNNLKLVVNDSKEIEEWVMKHFDKTLGADAVHDLFQDFYISLSQQALEKQIPENAEVQLMVEEDVPVAKVSDDKIVLSRTKTSSEEIEAVNKELDEIVGLEMVKNYIKSVQSHIKMQEIRRAQGMKTGEISKHMIFTGNPGTGKTTIARLLSRYMKAIGALSRGQLVEVTRADLVAQYVGQTAPLTMSVIKSALGGVLFIDEAYSLYRGKDDAFGLECIDTIVKAMEDHRDDLIIILAGYKKEMEVFMESNSGLKSRFPNIINFPDYTGEELRKIAQIQAKSKGYVIAEDALGKLEEFFDEVQKVNAAEAGNGRLARNVVEDAILTQSKRLIDHPNDAMDELRLEDFDFTIKVKPAK